MRTNIPPRKIQIDKKLKSIPNQNAFPIPRLPWGYPPLPISPPPRLNPGATRGGGTRFPYPTPSNPPPDPDTPRGLPRSLAILHRPGSRSRCCGVWPRWPGGMGDTLFLCGGGWMTMRTSLSAWGSVPSLRMAGLVEGVSFWRAAADEEAEEKG